MSLNTSILKPKCEGRKVHIVDEYCANPIGHRTCWRKAYCWKTARVILVSFYCDHICSNAQSQKSFLKAVMEKQCQLQGGASYRVAKSDFGKFQPNQGVMFPQPEKQCQLQGGASYRVAKSDFGKYQPNQGVMFPQPEKQCQLQGEEW